MRQNGKDGTPRVKLIEQSGALPGIKVDAGICARRAEVAEKTVKVLKACVPAAVPGIAFLSGGQ